MAMELAKLPGIGPKTAQRLAYHLASQPQENVRALSVALWEGRKAIRFCETCGNYSTGDACPICADPTRHNGQICVVRDPRDVAALERMHEYHGLYHVLHGTLSPMEGVGPDDIHIRELLARLLKPMNVKCTRIAHGVPVGGDLEYTDEVTLYKALEGRRDM